MNSKAKLFSAAVGISVLAAGCVSDGLSPREGGRQNYSTYIFSLYDEPDPKAQSPGLNPPMRLAVAQIGEVSPPELLLNDLRKESDLFSRVESIPGIVAIEEPPRFDRDERPTDHSARDAARKQMGRMMDLARGMGMDHLLLFGGTLDRAVNSNNLSLLDLTIVGAFAVPSKQIDATGRASAALVDLQTERVALIVSAESERSKLSSSAEVDENELELLRAVRDELAAELGKEVVESVREQVHRGGAEAAAP